MSLRSPAAQPARETNKEKVICRARCKKACRFFATSASTPSVLVPKRIHANTTPDKLALVYYIKWVSVITATAIRYLQRQNVFGVAPCWIRAARENFCSGLIIVFANVILHINQLTLVFCLQQQTPKEALVSQSWLSCENKSINSRVQ